jgi:hypothetical protein
MGLMLGGFGFTVSDQLWLPDPQSFAACVVIVYGEPPVTGVGQVTAPVLEFIVIPAGAPAPRLHVTGPVPELSDGLPDVKFTPQVAVAL